MALSVVEDFTWRPVLTLEASDILPPGREAEAATVLRGIAGPAAVRERGSELTVDVVALRSHEKALVELLWAQQSVLFGGYELVIEGVVMGTSGCHYEEYWHWDRAFSCLPKSSSVNIEVCGRRFTLQRTARRTTLGGLVSAAGEHEAVSVPTEVFIERGRACTEDNARFREAVLAAATPGGASADFVRRLVAPPEACVRDRCHHLTTTGSSSR